MLDSDSLAPDQPAIHTQSDLRATLFADKSMITFFTVKQTVLLSDQTADVLAVMELQSPCMVYNPAT